jgi:hypothetical protein
MLKEASREKVLSCGSMRARREEKLVEFPGRRACRAQVEGLVVGPVEVLVRISAE